MLLEEVKQLTEGEIVRDYEGNEYEIENVSGTGDGEFLCVWLKMIKFVRKVPVPSVKGDPVYFKKVGDAYVIGVEEPENPEWLSIEDIETLGNYHKPTRKFTKGEIVKDYLGNEYEIMHVVGQEPSLLELRMTKFKEPIGVPRVEGDSICFDRVGRTYAIGTRRSNKPDWLAIEDLTPLKGDPYDAQVSAADEIDRDFPDAQYFTDGEIVKDPHGNYYEVTMYDAPYWIRLRMRFTNKVAYASEYNSFDCIGKEYWVGDPESLVAQDAKDRHPDAYVTLENITKVKFGVARPRSGDLLLDSHGNLTRVVYERGDCTLRVDTAHISNAYGPIEHDTESFTIDVWSDYFKDCVKVGTDNEIFTSGDDRETGDRDRDSQDGEVYEAFTAENCARYAEANALKEIEKLIKQAVRNSKFQIVYTDAQRIKSSLEAKGFEVVGNTIRW